MHQQRAGSHRARRRDRRDRRLHLRRARTVRGALGVTLLGAVLPFGGYVVDRWLARRSVGQAG